ncbi:putative cell division protein, FtsQ [Hoyosella subflava DQS3-9A1]|uniref:Putative cell division protein, FtsQ n=1 Tax=Hoyosella subflava (strain DSM 45089 / JCM 17490 / NBRC 109087 / DQS3-9A1) TaxID=443218 RepID=F6EFG8_HOYSD|nr:putative cell division protein, FtsQ [Hoyosella subflava DQS3-9A1]
MILIIVLAVSAVVGVGAAAYFSPVLAVRSIDVETGPTVPDEMVRAVVDVAPETPLLQVSTHHIASRVAELPKVAEVAVKRSYPSTLRIVVTERVPAVFYDKPAGPHLMDLYAVTYAIEPPPPGVPRLVVDDPGADDSATRSALSVLSSLAPEMRGQVVEVSADSPADVRLVLDDGRTVIWGSSEGTERKARVANALLTQPGQIYDVSSPDLPTIR